ASKGPLVARDRCMNRQAALARAAFLFYCFFRFASTNLTERLIFLSLRWMQPIQQHGRRMPSLSSDTTRFTWASRVSCFLTLTVQQIHSLRDSGVRLCHSASAFVSLASAALR